MGSIYELPFPDASFDVVFAHAVFEHLSSPDAALAEVRRVLDPGGLVALRSPDWGGFIVTPDTPGLQAAIVRYTEIQAANGGDVHAGRKFPGWLRSAGFASVSFSATYECYQSPPVIGEYLALRLESADARAEAEALRNWSRHPDAIFAQAWCEILGSRSAGPLTFPANDTPGSSPKRMPTPCQDEAGPDDEVPKKSARRVSQLE